METLAHVRNTMATVQAAALDGELSQEELCRIITELAKTAKLLTTMRAGKDAARE